MLRFAQHDGSGLLRPSGARNDVVTHRLSQFLAAATFLLLFAGGLVTSTDSGLAVPDWPLSYGTLSPPMVGGIRYEHTHRLVAMAVGLLTLILTLWIGKKESRRSVRRLAIASLGAVVMQGILGGLTVLYRLPAPISAAHACLGPIFFCLVVSLAVLTESPHPSLSPRGGEGGGEGMLRLCLTTTLFIFLQILLGAIVRHTGGWIWIHVSWAFVVFIQGGLLVTRAWNDFPDRREIWGPSLFIGFLILLEFFLGIGTFAFTRLKGIHAGWAPTIFPTLHQTLGALLLAMSVGLALRFARGSGSSFPSLNRFLELTKPRLVFLVLWTVAVGFLLGSRGPVDFSLLFKTLAGTALVAAGSMVLNQYLEREKDGRMKRTQNRPLPDGRVKPGEALAFGIFLSATGLIFLLAGVNFLSAFISFVTLGSYLFLYTPLKPKTPWCTLAGALPGALPPMLGWAAARGALGREAWMLFAILGAWQLPHFFAIAWIYREDYERAGFRVLSVVDPTGERLGRQIMLYSLGLFLLSLLPALTGMTGLVYYLAAFLLGIWFLAASFFTAFKLEERSRAFFGSSLIYLTLLFLFMIVDWRAVR